jgi:hypothetical protein
MQLPLIHFYHHADKCIYSSAGPQNLFHFLSFCQLIHQFVEVPHLLGQRRGDLLDAVATNDSRDQVLLS